MRAVQQIMEDFEHSLLLLVLILALLNARPSRQRLTIPLLAIGLVLTFVRPTTPLELPWELILFVTVPILIWQSARRLTAAAWWNVRLELALWFLAAVLFSALFMTVGSLVARDAALLGILLGSILWRTGEGDESPAFISQIGPLTIIFLLVETAPAVETPNRYLGGVASGLAVGIVIALGAVWLVSRVKERWHDPIAVGQVYLAFALATLFEVSAVACALASVVVYYLAAVRRGVFRGGQMRPQPFNSWPGFLALLAVFVFLGWQAHQTLTGPVALEVGVGALIGLVVALGGQRLRIPVFSASGSVVIAAIRAAMLVLAALLLWPRDAPLTALALDLAVIAAALSLYLTISVLPDYLEMPEPR
jgi:hypothetical protein